MKRIFLLALVELTLLSIAGIGNAADWKAYTSNENCWALYDTQSITHPSKNIVRVRTKWILTDKGIKYFVEVFGKEFENVRYSIDLIEINCAEKKTHTLSDTKYDYDGKIIGSIKSPTAWMSIDPGTVNEALYKGVCSISQKVIQGDDIAELVTEQAKRKKEQEEKLFPGIGDLGIKTQEKAQMSPEEYEKHLLAPPEEPMKATGAPSNEVTSDAIVYFFGYAIGSSIIVFLIMGIIYFIGWRQSPKWKKRFWWVTFALAGLMNLMSLIVKKSLLSLLLAIMFGMLAVLIKVFQAKK